MCRAFKLSREGPQPQAVRRAQQGSALDSSPAFCAVVDPGRHMFFPYQGPKVLEAQEKITSHSTQAKPRAVAT